MIELNQVLDSFSFMLLFNFNRQNKSIYRK
jgi:hypothetical protein